MGIESPFEVYSEAREQPPQDLSANIVIRPLGSSLVSESEQPRDPSANIVIRPLGSSLLSASAAED